MALYARLWSGPFKLTPCPTCGELVSLICPWCQSGLRPPTPGRFPRDDADADRKVNP